MGLELTNLRFEAHRGNHYTILLIININGANVQLTKLYAT